MAWSPQRSKDTYAPIRSVAYARTHGGLETPPDPAGSVMYLVCNRRRQIWRLKPNGTSFQVEAQRGPLWPDVGNFRSTMGPIEGDASGCWYLETPATSQPGGPPQTVDIPNPSGAGTNTIGVGLHRLDADLNHVASYGFRVKSNTGPVTGVPWPIFRGAIGGGPGGPFTIGTTRTLITSSDGLTFDAPGGLVTFSLTEILSKCASTGTNGTATGGMIVVGTLGTVQNPLVFPSVSISAVAKATQEIPLPGFAGMLQDVGAGPSVGVCGGTGTTIYATKLGGAEYMAKWDGVTGNLIAYKTAADRTPQDQFRAQCIGGSSGVCYTTENNNEIVLRDGGLNLTARFRRADIEQFLGATNPANGISNFTFTGIGGR